LYIFFPCEIFAVCLQLSPCSCHVSDSGSWNELLFIKLYPNTINTVSYAVICNMLLLLLPIALRPFQFGLGFPYNWCPFHICNMQYSDIRCHCSIYCVWL
jgi:hypothetical protein